MKKNKILGIPDILNILPHRHPFVLIDRVLDYTEPKNKSRVGRSVTVIKNVSYNEPYFVGHFPHRPVMPGVLIIEAMAQAGAIACWNPGDPKMDVAIARISEVRIRRPVVPGDQLLIKSQVIKDRGQMVVLDITATVGDELVTQAEILATLTPQQLPV